MRFFTAVSVAFAAIAGVVSAQATTGTGTAVTPPVETGTMSGNAITAPIAGDSITAGESYTIAWTNVVGDSVTLVLVDGPADNVQPVATIVASVDNTGTYTWDVPANIPASDSYAIRIAYDSNPDNFNYSDRFVFQSDVTASPSTTTAASTTSEESSTSTEESSTETTSTESETSSITSAATTSAETTSSIRTSTRRPSTTSSDASPTESSDGAPTNAASSNLSSPVAIIMAVLAAAMFIH